MFTQTAGFTLSFVRTRRRCLRLRQSRSASAEITPTSRCVSFSARSLACYSRSGRSQPHCLTPPRSAHVEAVTSRARLLSLVVALFGMVVNSAVPCEVPLQCVAGNASSLSLCFEVLHSAPFVGLYTARFPRSSTVVLPALTR